GTTPDVPQHRRRGDPHTRPHPRGGGRRRAEASEGGQRLATRGRRCELAYRSAPLGASFRCVRPRDPAPQAPYAATLATPTARGVLPVAVVAITAMAPRGRAPQARARGGASAAFVRAIHRIDGDSPRRPGVAHAARARSG